MKKEVKHGLLVIFNQLTPALLAAQSGEDNTAVPTRKLVKAPRQDSGDRLFIQPADVGPDRERVEAHQRLNFANNWNYADRWTGLTRTYDPAGNYVCGACNKLEHKNGCTVIDKTVDPVAGSCRHWEDLDASDPELDMSGVCTPALAAYGVAANGEGFGCRRCPYASPAKEQDSKGRDLYCGKGDFRVPGNACCALNGAKLK